MRVYKGTGNCTVYAELGRRELKSNVDSRLKNYWLRLAQGKESILTSTS